MTVPLPTRTRTSGTLHVIGVVLAVAAGLWLLYRLEGLLLALALATWCAYVLAPLVELAERPIRFRERSYHLRRGPAVALVFVLLSGGATTAIAVLLPTMADQVTEIVANAPALTTTAVAWEQSWSGAYQRLRLPREVREHINQSVVAVGGATVEYARASLLAGAATLLYLPWLVLIPILGFFLLKDASGLRAIVVKTLPSGGRWRSQRLFDEVNATLAAYMRAQLLACVVVGSLTGVGFAIMGIPYAVLLGVLSGVLEFIPLVGPLILATVAVLVTALNTPILALWALAFLAVLRLVEDYVIYPRLLGGGVHLHPLAVILVVLAGAELGGGAGVFLAVPVVAVGSVAVKHFLEWREADKPSPANT